MAWRGSGVRWLRQWRACWPAGRQAWLGWAAVMAVMAGWAVAPAAQAQATSFTLNGASFQLPACANEGQVCSFTGTRGVAFGANGQFVIKLLTAGANCTTTQFGDPAPGVAKACYLGPVYGPRGAPRGTPSAPVAPTAASRVAASRLLTQATYGPTAAEIDRVAVMAPSVWLTEQFNTAPMDSHWDYVMVRKGPIGCTVCNAAAMPAVMESFWTQAVRGPDQLRQRTVLALSEIFVVSTVNSAVEVQPDAHASYLDLLSRNAFGNFRTLLEQVATHPTMGRYLSHLGNEKEDAASGRIPDENFAREVMQLFTIGLWQLNEDGSRKKDSAGQDIPSYGQSDVMGLAKVFTGWGWRCGAALTEACWRGWVANDGFQRPMVLYPQYHSASEKRFLGTVVPVGTGGDASLKAALDALFNHPNVGPFIGSQLIKRLVTSNPSPAYVARVARAFNNNGAGVRGDLQAVLRAVLLDVEARDDTQVANAQWGKLREPMVRFGHFLRAFDARAASGYYRIWNLEDPVTGLGQNPLRAPSVFNWYRPSYAPPGDILRSGLVAPEFQITHETTVTGYANFVTNLVENGHNYNADRLVPNYNNELVLSVQPEALVDRMNLVLCAGGMSASTRATIIAAVNALPVSAFMRRIQTAVALTMLSPDFIVQK